MSEAESLNLGSDAPTPAESVDAPPIQLEFSSSAVVPPPDTEDSWQTLNFPGAIGVDHIPVAGESSQLSSENADPEVLSALASLNESPQPEPVVQPVNQVEQGLEQMVEQSPVSIPDASTSLVQQLQQENQELHDRLTQLENDLVQQQIEFQLVVARSLQTSPESAQESIREADQTKELKAAQERISQLFSELDLSQQAAQRQQILIETLSEQLESSQERIAQLERDCALAQQRYNEQVQQLMQTENICRDLRMRLHRQQRQTLQFKAALEKCLEMPPVQGQSLLDPEAGVSAPPVVVPPVSTAQVTTPKNQPVRPWSAVSGQNFDASLFGGQGFSKPLSEIVKMGSANDESANPVATGPIAATPDISGNAENELSEDWADQLFPNSSGAPLYSGVSSEQANAIFDLSPFTAAGGSSVTNADQSASSHQGDDGLLQMLAAVPLDADELGNPLGSFWGQQNQDDPLWDDLAKLIEQPASAPVVQPPAVNLANSNQASDESRNGEQQAAEVRSIADVEPPQPARTTIDLTNRKPLQLVSWGAKQEVQPVSAESIPEESEPTPAVVPVTPAAARSFTLKTHSKATEATGATALSVELLTPGSPSPVVYPLRPSKKLKSLAAVELPSFPRAR